MQTDLDQLARRQVADYDTAQPGTAFGSPGLSLTIAEAYELQFKVVHLRLLRGEAIAGYKVGCVSRAVQNQLGINEPVFGHIFAGEAHRGGAKLPAKRFERLAVEGEFAVRIAQDVPGADWLVANPAQAIDAAFPVIELHNYICRAPFSERAQELIANNGLHAGVVLPDLRPGFRGPDGLLDETITVNRNGTALGAATGAELPGGPIASVLWLAERLKAFGIGLRRGQIVLTGSPLPLFEASPGDRFEVKSGSLGNVALEIAR
ncbi:MAG TPA: fumarylacetoacetate hydrolase family protein [Bryobacteraceae bacterium]|nr:fumarylacetoacetate hydrolase family protein [Bryobacteraceae bacterium]